MQRNSLTQRTVGPNFTSETCVLTENMKPGDYAGLAAISAHYGMVGVKCDENGNRYVFRAAIVIRIVVQRRRKRIR